MAVSRDDLPGLLNSVRRSYPREKYAQTLKHSDYPGVRAIASHGKPRRGGGDGFRFTVRGGTTGNAKQVGFFEDDSTNVTSNTIRGRTYMTYGTTSYAIDKKELSENGGVDQLYSLIDERRDDAFEDALNLHERNVFGCPANANDDKTPDGLFGVLPLGPSGTSWSDGFNGVTLRYRSSGVTRTIQGIDLSSSLNERCKRYVGRRSTVIDKKFIQSQLRKAMKKTRFSAPMMKGLSMDFVGILYMGIDDHNTMQNIVEAKNTREAGLSVHTVDGNPMVGGAPCVYAPQLDSDVNDDIVGSYKSIIGVNWKEIEIILSPDRWMKEQPSYMKANSHDVAITPIDWGYQFINYNPCKSGFHFHTAHELANS